MVITGNPDGAEVFVNGTPAGFLPLGEVVRLGEGPAKVELRAAGHRPETRSLTIAGGKREHLHFRLQPASRPAPQQQEDPGTISSVDSSQAGRGFASMSRPLAWATVVAASVAASFGVVQTREWFRKRDEFDNHTRPVMDTMGMVQSRVRDCGVMETNRGGEECQQLHRDMERAKRLAILGYISGAALAAGATALFVFSRGQDSGTLAISCGAMPEALAGGKCRVSF